MTKEVLKVEGFNYPPYTILKNADVANAHNLALTHFRQGDDELTAVKKLYSLTQVSADRKHYPGNQFEDTSDDSPSCFVGKGPILSSTQSLLTYTAARLEKLLRFQAIETPKGTDNGISLMYSNQLAQLSNVYRARGERDQGDYNYRIAHSLSMYALRFHRPDHHGYSQTLGHWLDGEAFGYKHHKEQLPHSEEILKLSLALEEIGYGSENDYSHMIAERLVELYRFKEEDENAQELEDHFKNTPMICSIDFHRAYLKLE